MCSIIKTRQPARIQLSNPRLKASGIINTLSETHGLLIIIVFREPMAAIAVANAILNNTKCYTEITFTDSKINQIICYFGSLVVLK